MDDAKSALSEIRDVLWPAGDPDTVWSSDTIEEIASIVDEAGYGPERNARQVRQVPRARRRRQAGWMDTITGLLGKFTGGGDDKKAAPTSTPTPTDAAHAAHAGPPPRPPQQHRPVAAPPPATAAPVAESPEPLYWPPRRNAA